MANPVRSTFVLAIVGALAALLLLAAGCGGARTAAPSLSTTSTATAAPTEVATPQPHPYTVAISAGHGGPDNIGAVHKDAQGQVDLVEKDINLDIARRLDALLRASRYRTVMIRDGDYSLAATVPGDFAQTVRNESQARADTANAAGADIILAVHFNGSDQPSQSGTAVYYDPDRSFGVKSKVLATSINDAIIARLHAIGYDTQPRGVMNDSMTAGAALTGEGHTFLLGESPGFRPTQMPGMIGEALFLTNDTEAALLQRDGVRQAIAQAYKDGIGRYFSWLSAQGR
jgi:N-acetylmuramoyl-L-alanine amidase